MDCKVELERAGMFIPEAGWERSLPTSPAHSHRHNHRNFWSGGSIFQWNASACVCSSDTQRALTSPVHADLCECRHQRCDLHVWLEWQCWCTSEFLKSHKGTGAPPEASRENIVSVWKRKKEGKVGLYLVGTREVNTVLGKIPEESLKLHLLVFGQGNRKKPGFPKNRKDGSWRTDVTSLLMWEGRETTCTERLLFVGRPRKFR